MSQDNHHRLAKNNFDLLRLLFAGTVCLVHVYELSGFQQLKWITRFLSSTVAVRSFFVISGFLIVMSFERSTSIVSYSIKRIRRIYPAYFVVVFFGLFLYMGNFGKYGDFSYGFYILHFPVIQILLQGNWFNGSPWYFLFAVIFITTAGAIAMWHLVEKQFLLRNSHYIAVTTSSQSG